MMFLSVSSFCFIWSRLTRLGSVGYSNIVLSHSLLLFLLLLAFGLVCGRGFPIITDQLIAHPGEEHGLHGINESFFSLGI